MKLWTILKNEFSFHFNHALIAVFYVNFQLEEYSHVAENSSAKIKFFERCSQLCWMMAIQDPPMHLDFGPDKDSVIDKNVFRLYTKSGENVDFVVWPAVFLHQNGPIVQKGVLQPKWSYSDMFIAKVTLVTEVISFSLIKYTYFKLDIIYFIHFTLFMQYWEWTNVI